MVQWLSCTIVHKIYENGTKIFLIKSRCFDHGPFEVHVRCADKINITCPYGHSNILYLRTCTISCRPVLRRQNSLNPLFLCSLRFHLIRRLGDCFSCNLILPVENFDLRVRKSNKRLLPRKQIELSGKIASCRPSARIMVPNPDAVFSA